MQTDLDNEMRAGEWYHSLRVPPKHWPVIRVDGRSFTRLTRDMKLEKPFDPCFSSWMEATAKTLLLEFDATYVYFESDEISVVLRPEFDMFNRSVEKLVSISAGVASSAFSLQAETHAHFDSRVWVGYDVSDVTSYLLWRQADAARCALNGWVYYTLREYGASPAAATSAMRGMTRAQKHDCLMERGINFNDLPTWQRRGAGIHVETYVKDGFNPITQMSEQATRRRPKVELSLPMRNEYENFLLDILSGGGVR